MNDKLFIKQKENIIQNLDQKKDLYEENIKNIDKILKNNREIEKKLKFENAILSDEYNNLKRLFKERGLIIEIFNNNYDLKEWDNLFLKKVDDKYIITTKKDEILKVFNEETSNIFDECISDSEAYSIVIIRVTAKNIRAQMHLS